MLNSTSCLAVLLIPLAALLAHRGRAREAAAAMLLLVALQELPLAAAQNPLEVVGEVFPGLLVVWVGLLGVSVNLVALMHRFTDKKHQAVAAAAILVVLLVAVVRLVRLVRHRD